MEIDEQTLAQVTLLRERGMQVNGPVPMGDRETMATRDSGPGMAGYHVQVGAGSRWVQGYGGTPGEAVRDAVAKLEPYDPTQKVHPV
ncbi:MAG: hypothetical protein U0237_03050 [Thermoleophilia bacterium]